MNVVLGVRPLEIMIPRTLSSLNTPSQDPEQNFPLQVEPWFAQL